MSDKLANHYRQIPNERLLQIALYEASGLKPEARTVLLTEIKTRGFDPAVSRAVAVQTSVLSQHDLDLLVEAVRRQGCPACGQNKRLLNAGMIAETKSYVILTTFNKHTAIACPDCLAEQAKRAALMTAALGWWGFPWGPIHTVQALTNDIRTMLQRKRDDPSKVLRKFVKKNPGVAIAFAEGVYTPQNGFI